MSDIGQFDELYLINPEGELVKMGDNEHHLEYLLSYFPDEENYDEEFWDFVFEEGWIRIELKKNHRDGWDLSLNGESLSKMKKAVRDNFLSRVKHGENKVHIVWGKNAYPWMG
jgi:hypothetical protein